MEAYMNQEDILNFVSPKDQASYIKVFGVGGGGSNAVNHMYRQGIKGVDFVICNTDAQSLEASPVPTKIQLGKGLGAGNMPAVASEAASDKKEEIKRVLSQGTQMLFITAGMGGGTGTGAAPVIAAIAKEIELDDEVKKILTVAIVTTPFSFEGNKRKNQAQEGIALLRQQVDAILVINNDKLRDFGKMSMKDAFAMADNVLTTAAKGISEIITVSSYIQIDFKDVNTVMSNSGVALMGYGQGVGETRAKDAALMAMDSPLLNDNSIEGAKNMLLYISSGEKTPLLMDEIETITGLILSRSGNGVDLIWGAGEDATLGEGLSLTLVATGFNEKSYSEPMRVKLAAIETNGMEVSTERVEERVIMMKPKEVITLEEDPVFVSELKSEELTGVQEEKEATEMPITLSDHIDPNLLADDWFADLMAIETPEIKTHVEDVKPIVEMVDVPVEETMEETVEETVSAPIYSFDTEFLVDGVLKSESISEMVVDTKVETVAGMEENDLEEELQDTGHSWVAKQVLSDLSGEHRGFSEREIADALEDMEVVDMSNPASENFAGQTEVKTETQTMVDVLPAPLPSTPVFSVPVVAAARGYQERMARLNRFKEDIDRVGIDYMERIPAWKRKNIELKAEVPSFQSEVGDLMVSLDGKVTKNAYLKENEKVD